MAVDDAVAMLAAEEQVVIVGLNVGGYTASCISPGSLGVVGVWASPYGNVEVEEGLVRRGALVQVDGVDFLLDYVDKSQGVGGFLPKRTLAQAAVDLEIGLQESIVSRGVFLRVCFGGQEDAAHLIDRVDLDTAHFEGRGGRIRGQLQQEPGT